MRNDPVTMRLQFTLTPRAMSLVWGLAHDTLDWTGQAMYQPTAFAVHDLDRVRAMLLRAPLAQIVVASGDTFLATPAPLLLDSSGSRLIGHLAKPNDVGRHALASADGVPCIAIFTGVDGYVSPSAYPSKLEHGKVVPTWNYETVHVHGRLHTHPDAERTLAAVRMLTAHFEADRAAPWADTDAPTDYIEGLLRAIVAIEITIDRIEAKQKFSQNRPVPDQHGVLTDLASRGPSAEALLTQMKPVLQTPEAPELP
jgi:transcriptional regulator